MIPKASAANLTGTIVREPLMNGATSAVLATPLTSTYVKTTSKVVSSSTASGASITISTEVWNLLASYVTEAERPLSRIALTV